MKQLNDKVNLALRRVQTGSNSFTAAQVKDTENIENIVKNDEGYYLFKQIRNSPAYLETRKKRCFCHDTPVRSANLVYSAVFC